MIHATSCTTTTTKSPSSYHEVCHHDEDFDDNDHHDDHDDYDDDHDDDEQNIHGLEMDQYKMNNDHNVHRCRQRFCRRYSMGIHHRSRIMCTFLMMVLLVLLLLLLVVSLVVWDGPQQHQSQLENDHPYHHNNNNNNKETNDHDDDDNDERYHQLSVITQSLQDHYYSSSHGSWKMTNDNDHPDNDGNSTSLDDDDFDNPDRGTIDTGMIGWWNAANTLLVLSKSQQQLLRHWKHQTQEQDQQQKPSSTTTTTETATRTEVVSLMDDIDDVIEKMFQLQNMTGILESRSYDDMGWIILSWIEVYHATSLSLSSNNNNNNNTNNYNRNHNRDGSKYLLRSKHVWDEILSQGAWTDTPDECNGGLYWAGEIIPKLNSHGDEDTISTTSGDGVRLFYKNAITNSLFMMASLELYFIEQQQQQQYQEKEDSSVSIHYLEWAKRVWEWIYTSDLIVKSPIPPKQRQRQLQRRNLNGDQKITNPNTNINITTSLVVCDGLDLQDKNGQCNCNNEEGWTYNQGVLVGAIGLLHRAVTEEDLSKKDAGMNNDNDNDGDSKRDDDLLSDAFNPKTLIHVADSIVYNVIHDPPNDWLDEHRILVEKCPSTGCDYDQQQFKGIFVRYLRLYVDSVGKSSLLYHQIHEFLDRQATAVWNLAMVNNDHYLIDFEWSNDNHRSKKQHHPPPNVTRRTSTPSMGTMNAITQTSGLDSLLAATNAPLDHHNNNR